MNDMDELDSIREKDPIRVLHVFGRLNLGGAESRIMDLYRNIDRTRVQFDFLVHTDAVVEGNSCPTSEELMAIREPDYFDEEIRSLGGNIYAIPRLDMKHILSYRRAVKQFFNDHSGIWQVVQGHMTSTGAIYLPIAKKSGVSVTASHVRSGGTDPGLKGILTNLLRSPFKDEGTADYYLSCTEAAARKVYGDEQVDAGKVHIIPNAINVAKFRYDEKKRNELREALEITNAVVIGHVGRFHYAKNHEYLVRVFAEMVNLIREDKAGRYTILYGLPLRLMLLGEGPLMDSVKSLVTDLHMESRVMFLGNHSNVSDYYQAMDYFCFPSRYEGLPGTVVEAQASGLQCLISDSITEEVDITKLVGRMSIELEPREWARKILSDLCPSGFNDTNEKGNILPESRPFDRKLSADRLAREITKAGFDASYQAQMMMYFYEHGAFPRG